MERVNEDAGAELGLAFWLCEELGMPASNGDRALKSTQHDGGKPRGGVMSSTLEKQASSGISMGTAFALILSWGKWHSFWWAFLHGIFGWGYVAYYFIRGFND